MLLLWVAFFIFVVTGTGPRFAAERIYLRRTFRLDRVPRHAAIRLYSRGTVDVYLNGELASSVVMRGTRDSIGVSILPLQPETVATLQVGENLVAVRAEMDGETKFVDEGLVELPE